MEKKIQNIYKHYWLSINPYLRAACISVAPRKRHQLNAKDIDVMSLPKCWWIPYRPDLTSASVFVLMDLLSLLFCLLCNQVMYTGRALMCTYTGAIIVQFLIFLWFALICSLPQIPKLCLTLRLDVHAIVYLRWVTIKYVCFRCDSIHYRDTFYGYSPEVPNL